LRNFKAYEEFHFDVMPPALPKLDTNKMFHWSEKSLKRVRLERDEKKVEAGFSAQSNLCRLRGLICDIQL